MGNNMKIKIVIFCRVSSREQEVDGYSLPAQEKLLNEYALKQGYNPKEIKLFSISESASGKKQRNFFLNMLSYVKEHKIEILLCEKVDRLTRNLRDATDMNDWLNENPNHQIHFVKENVVLSRDSKSNEKFIWNIKVSVAQYYIDNLSEEVKKGQKEKLAQGWLPTTPPVGYITTGDKGHKIHVIDEEKAPLAIKMFEYYASGNYSVKQLTAKMAKEGLRNRHGHKIVMSRIHELLQNPFYIGKNRWNGIITQGEHECLIDKDLFERVQRRLKGKGGPVYSKHFFLFNKLIKCGECSGTITWEIHKNIIYGHCHHFKACSQSTWAKEFDIEIELAQVLEELEVKNKRIQTWIHKALKEGHEDESHYYSTAVNELTKQHEVVKTRLDRLYDDKVDGKISQEFYDAKFRKYTDEREGILEELGKHANADTKYLEKTITFYELSQSAKERYLYTKGIEEKRVMLNDIFKSLTFRDGKLYFEFTPVFTILKKLADISNRDKTIADVEPVLLNFEQRGIIDLKTQTETLQLVCPDLLRD